jgi:hypothetical protein
MSSARACCCNDASTTSRSETRPAIGMARGRLILLVVSPPSPTALGNTFVSDRSRGARRARGESRKSGREGGLCRGALRAQRVRRHNGACGRRSMHCKDRYTHTHTRTSETICKHIPSGACIARPLHTHPCKGNYWQTHTQRSMHCTTATHTHPCKIACPLAELAKHIPKQIHSHTQTHSINTHYRCEVAQCEC